MRALAGLCTLYAVCACAAGLYGFERAEARRARELDALREELRALRRVAGEDRVRAPLPALLALGAAASTAPAPAPAASTEAPASPRTAPPPPSGAEAAARLEDAFLGQAGDADWAGAAARDLEGAIRPVLPAGSQVRSLSCRSSLCRLEMSHPDEAALERFQETALLAGPAAIWRGPLYATRTAGEGGTLATVTYLGRGEADLPFGGP